MAYEIRFAESAEEHYARLSARQQRTVIEAIKVQLKHQPLRETRNRKPLRSNPLAPWELRAGALRVFYEVDAEKPDVVNIVAIGIKRGNRLFVAGEEICI